MPQHAFHELELCVGCVTKLDGNCLNVWAWNVIEAISKCGPECLGTSFFHIPANSPYPDSLSLPPPSGIQGPLACPNFCEPAFIDNPPYARLRSTINGGEQACYSEAYDNGNPPSSSKFVFAV